MRLLLIAVIFVSTAAAQNGAQFKDWNAKDATTKPKATCASLQSLTSAEMKITSTEVIAATGPVPEHCRISGVIPPQIGFEVNLPTAWNRRMYMFGNGGYAGEPTDHSVRTSHRTAALNAGFAVASTDTGHKMSTEPNGTFALNQQVLIDYAHRAVHVTSLASRKLIQSYYTSPPASAYFDGCSTGGRQGLILAQRYPEDFDGIVVGAPVLDFTSTMIEFTWIARAQAEAPIPSTKLKLLTERVYAKCDASDGLKDGVIDDPRRCPFDPAKDLPRCATNSDDNTCFTTPQIGTLQKIYADVGSQGKRIMPGFPVGAEGGWDGWVVSGSKPSLGYSFAEAFWRYLAFPKKDPAYQLSSFDFANDPQRVEEIRKLLDATNPDLSAFQHHGGKIVMYFGWADPALNPRMGIDYFENVQRKMGASTQDFMRLFMVPGMYHCGGGVGTNSFDATTVLVRWKEQGIAPASIPATRVVKDQVTRTRPLCPYPQVAKYKGSGSIDEAQNFVCATKTDGP